MVEPTRFWKNISQIGSFPHQVGVKIKNVWIETTTLLYKGFNQSQYTLICLRWLEE